MDSILGPSIRANRRLRSLHIPSPEVHNNSSRRFNSLRATTATNTITTEEDDDDISVRIRLVPNVGSTNRCFVFDVVDRKLIAGGPSIKLGRYSDRTVISDRLSFKNTSSSSGTFVNHVRLTPANTESIQPHELVDGDLIQLGVDYKGGLEPMYRAVKMRLEVNRREWMGSYNLAAFQQLRHQLLNPTQSKEGIQECCICLYCIAPFQALFIAPCSHVYHYRCLRPLLQQNYPGFSCPLCRTYSNLEDSVAVEEEEVLQMLGLDEEEGSGGGHQREKTVLDEENQEQPPIPIAQPPSFLRRQLSEEVLAMTLVGSPPNIMQDEV
ncbi:hypothetical protein G6F37_000645 [Rhizopus arrhizus]|nr:hypothetical protein G6F38_000100 [Rhizopus arrhizus]KAG1164044.1 hypothetical protein G6F37_000645 [Rhizopus arrhizus]